MKAVFLDYATMGDGLDLATIENAVDELTVYESTADADVASRISDAELVLTNKIKINAGLIAAADKLRFIGLTATGTDNIDLDAARAHRIAVANIRDYCTASVAEHVLGMLLMLTHSLSNFDASVRAGDWQRSRDAFLLAHPIRELSAMTLGIVGFGALGRGVTERARAFGMQVLVSARPGAKDVPADRHAFEDVLRQADAISLHCPLNDTTRNLMGQAQFEAMQAGAFLINTARGGLIDSAALAAALKSGQIAGAAVDVLPQEPPVDGDPLLDYLNEGAANLIVTPHVAWAGNEARQNALDELAANIRAFRQGEDRHRVA